MLIKSITTQIRNGDAGASKSIDASRLIAKSIYTCPMHPEVQADRPGNCPKCGMTLELQTPKAGNVEDEDGELRDMTRRFWIASALTVPVFVLALAHLFPALARQAWSTGDTSRWIQFSLTTPVVFWAGLPFFVRGWRSIVTRHLNMFTLIAIGVSAAYVFSHDGHVPTRSFLAYPPAQGQSRHLF